MEEHRNTVINLHATLFQIISKFTSNISKNTSKFTSKTKLGRGGAIGAWGSQGRTTSRFHVPVGAMGAKGDGANEDGSPPPADEGSPPGVGPKAQGPHGTPAGGEIHSRGGSQGG